MDLGEFVAVVAAPASFAWQHVLEQYTGSVEVRLGALLLIAPDEFLGLLKPLVRGGLDMRDAAGLLALLLRERLRRSEDIE